MSREFKAIARIVKAGRKTVQNNGVWSAIHNETGCGSVTGRTIVFTDNDLDILRRYAKSLTGLDPLHDTTGGSRIDLAGQVSNEKLSTQSVFGHLVVMATLGSGRVPITGQEIAVPQGTVLSVPSDKLEISTLADRPILVVENGAIMPECHRLQLPASWANAVVIYRGHNENARHVATLIDSQPSEKLGLFYDFDPDGLSMALSFGKGHILIPEALPSSAPSKRSTFRQQASTIKRLKKRSSNTPWAQVVDVMDSMELAIMQEHMLVYDVPLTTRPSINTLQVN